MKENLDSKSRKELANKIVALLGKEMQPLPKEVQIILADDLVTVFESRLKVLNRAQSPVDFYVELPQKVSIN